MPLSINNSGDLLLDANTLLENNYDDENEPTMDGADYILGLGSKKKKAEKKLKKAEKALEKGNVKKAERKLGKAIKKGAKATSADQNSLLPEIQNEQLKIDAAKAKTQDFVNTATGNTLNVNATPTLVDPITRGDAASVPGSGSTIPLGGSGGGGGADTMPDFSSTQEGTDPIVDNGDTGIPVSVTNEKPKSSVFIIIAIAIAAITLFIYLLKKKK